jgi:molecular chaperone DnaK
MKKQVNFGIDLGTTNSLIAKFDLGNVQVLRNPVGFRETLPSVVAFRQDRILVGDKAREYLNKDAVNVFSSFKRKMGTEEKYYVVNKDDNITPIELSSMVLKELQQFVPETKSLEAAVVTIPASFDSMQSSATLKAAQLAGIQHVFLLQEPIAAALAYFNQIDTLKFKQQGKWLVYDLGGGTFDVALLSVEDSGIKVLDHEGNNFLGGVDFDYLIISKLIVPKIEEALGITNFEEILVQKFGPQEKLFYQLQYLCEEAKKELSIASTTYIEFSVEHAGKQHSFEIEITKTQIDELFAPKINETVKFIHQLLNRNQLEAADINQIILVGGSTYLDIVRSTLPQDTGIAINHSIDPTTAVAVGAAYYASDKFYDSIDIETANEVLEQALANAHEDLDFKINLGYSSTSRDTEEVLLIQCDKDPGENYYRISRTDGGFDTGIVPLRTNKTEFLSLVANASNQFTFNVYDAQQNIISGLQQHINISQGKFAVDGQPLPHDICLEVDDIENAITKSEVVFARNSLLPQKRTVYREITRTIKKGSEDSVVINILEGSGDARPSSNLTIGCVEISGKQLDFDLVKGSDIEIQLHMDESRILHSSVYLVMTKQEFKNVFSISEKVVHIARLKEQSTQLESDLRDNLHEFEYTEQEEFAIECEQLLQDVREAKLQLGKLTAKDNNDAKYIVAEQLWRISQRVDSLGGKDRLRQLVERYLDLKQHVKDFVYNQVDMEKERMKELFNKHAAAESTVVKSRNASVIEGAMRKLDDIYSQANSYTHSYLIGYYHDYLNTSDDEYTDPKLAKNLLAKAHQAIQNENYVELRNYLVQCNRLLHTYGSRRVGSGNQNFTGTGLG